MQLMKMHIKLSTYNRKKLYLSINLPKHTRIQKHSNGVNSNTRIGYPTNISNKNGV